MNGCLYCRRGMLHKISLVSIKSNIESIVLVAAIFDYVNFTLPHVNGDDHVGIIYKFNVYNKCRLNNCIVI